VSALAADPEGGRAPGARSARAGAGFAEFGPLGRRFSPAMPTASPHGRRPSALAAVLALAIGLGAVAPHPAEAGRPARRVSLLADPVFLASADRGLAHLYDMELAAAGREFGRISQRYPDHPAGPFLGALTTWWQILADPQDTSRDARFLAAMEVAIERADRRLRRDDDDPDAKFFKSAALAFRGRLRAMRHDLLAAAFDCKRAFALLRDVVEDDPGNHDLYFGLGLYDYFADVLPDRHPVLKPAALFAPKADASRGIRRLAHVARHGRFARTEAAYYLLQIEYFFEKDPEESLRWARWLRRRHPGNPLFHELEGRVLLRWGPRPAARRAFDEILALWRSGAPGYTPAQAERAFYSLAILDMRDGEYERALDRLARQERLGAARRDGPLRPLGLLRQGMTLDALGRRPAAVASYRRVLALDDVGGTHARARAYLRSAYPARGDDGDDPEPAS